MRSQPIVLQDVKRTIGPLTVAGVLLGIVLMAIPFFASRYAVSICFSLYVSIALAQSWNLVSGYTGLVSLGHAAFFGIGAYATGLLMTKANLPFLPAVLGGGLASVLFAVAIASPMFRFRGFYFSIGTMVLAEALRIWMVNWSFTGGAQGINVPLADWLDATAFYYLALALAVASTLFIVVILRTRLGLGLRAIRDNEKSARNSGVNIFRTKLIAFTVAALLAGLAGGLQAEYMGSIEPYSTFSMQWTISALTIVIIGGIGTITGPIIGAICLTLLNLLLVSYGAVDLVIMGLLLIVIIRFLPGGIWSGMVQAYKAIIRKQSERGAGRTQ
ncbi:branched-chain amino acid ABC transporter permease [Brevibacillus fluminis]|uniref:branched-chain amino acid ABC transporter permease n=1 Tax=Brevibacillus fluminis TaxID=511487 RepID=UPI003F8C01D6